MCDNSIDSIDELYDTFEENIKQDDRIYEDGYRFLIWLDDTKFYYLVYKNSQWTREILSTSINCHGWSNKVTEILHKRCEQTHKKQNSYWQ